MALQRALEQKGHCAWCHPYRGARRTGDCWQFRWWPVLRLHSLWRHHQHRGAAGSRQQATRYPYLRQRHLRGKDERLPGPPSRRPDAEGQDRGSTCPRTPQCQAIRRPRDFELSWGFCQARSRCPRCNGSLRSTCRQTRQRSACQLPSQTAVEWCYRHPDHYGLEAVRRWDKAIECVAVLPRSEMRKARFCSKRAGPGARVHGNAQTVLPRGQSPVLTPEPIRPLLEIPRRASKSALEATPSRLNPRR